MVRHNRTGVKMTFCWGAPRQMSNRIGVKFLLAQKGAVRPPGTAHSLTQAGPLGCRGHPATKKTPGRVHCFAARPPGLTLARPLGRCGHAEKKSAFVFFRCAASGIRSLTHTPSKKKYINAVCLLGRRGYRTKQKKGSS